MRRVGPSNVDEMVLAFLCAEVDSPRFQHCFHAVLGGDVTVVRSPNMTPPENMRRRHALACCRGFEMDTLLFRGFPSDPEWVRVALTRDEIGELWYANYPTWVSLSEGSRRVADGAQNVDTAIQVEEDPRTNIRDVEKNVAAGERYPEIVLAAFEPQAQHVIIEGHTRATAYFRALPDDEEIEMIAGYSETLDTWAFV